MLASYIIKEIDNLFITIICAVKQYKIKIYIFKYLSSPF